MRLVICVLFAGSLFAQIPLPPASDPWWQSTTGKAFASRTKAWIEAHPEVYAKPSDGSLLIAFRIVDSHGNVLVDAENRGQGWQSTQPLNVQQPASAQQKTEEKFKSEIDANNPRFQEALESIRKVTGEIEVYNACRAHRHWYQVFKKRCRL